MGRRKQIRNSQLRLKQKWFIALYIRLSKEDGNDVSNSVINQKDRLTAYLSTFEEDHELVDIYADDGCSGTDANREEFQRMLMDIREHRINCIIVKDLSRLSRNVTDATYYIENVFIEHDVRFISLELPALDSYKHPEQMNSILVPIQNVINDDFCRQTSIKVRGVFNQKRMMGQFIGAFAPYGYQKDPKNRHGFIIDEEAARVVRDIFAWYVKEGVSKGGIARKLNESGVLNPSAYKKHMGLKYVNPRAKTNDAMWGPKTIREILSNQMYLGHMVQGRYRIKSYKVHKQISTPQEEWYIVENTHDPVIDREIFDLAQKLQEKDTRQTPGKRAVYLLSGFVRCPDCQKAMVRSQGGSKVKTAYYHCRTYRDKSKKTCSKHSIRADVLENAVLNAISAQVRLVSSFEAIAGEINQTPSIRGESQRLTAILNSQEKELVKVTAIRDSLYSDWKNGDLTKDDYRRLKIKYEEQTGCIKKSIEALKKERQSMRDETNVENSHLQYFLKHGAMKELCRSVVVDLVDTIFVHEDGEVEILFNFRDQYKLIIESIDNNTGEPQTPYDMY